MQGIVSFRQVVKKQERMEVWERTPGEGSKIEKKKSHNKNSPHLMGKGQSKTEKDKANRIWPKCK